MRFADCDIDMQLMMVNHDCRWLVRPQELRCYNYATTMGNVHASRFITDKVSIDFQFFGNKISHEICIMQPRSYCNATYIMQLCQTSKSNMHCALCSQKIF
jgi:hypothetical protein